MLSSANHLTASVIGMAGVIVCFSGMATCVLWAVTISIDRADQVNSLLPPEQKIGYPLGIMGPERHWRFEKEYERLFPDRSQRRKERLLWLFGAVFLVGLALCAATLFS